MIWFFKQFFNFRRGENLVNPYTEETVRNWEEELEHNHVWLSPERLYEAAERLVQGEADFAVPPAAKRGVYPEDPRAWFYHRFWTDVVNYDFQHPVVGSGRVVRYSLRNIFGGREVGYYAMAAAFYRAFGERPILARDILPCIATLSRTKKFFKGYNSIPMIHERRLMLSEACGILETYFGGDPWNLFEEGRFRAYGRGGAPGIFELLVGKFPNAFGGDSYPVPAAPHLRLHFYKRVHHLLITYHKQALASRGALRPIADIGEVGPMPDYQLPRSYEHDGIMRFSDELRDLIRRAIPIQPGSQMMLEVRGATVKAQVEELRFVNALRAVRGLPPRHIDYVDFYRWLRGRSIGDRGLPPFVCFSTDF